MARFNAYRITDFSELQSFECGLEEMDIFIHNETGLKMSVENHYCQCFGVCNEDNITVGLFALSFDSISLDNDNLEDLFSGVLSSIPNVLPKYIECFKSKHHHPALEIVYLAVHKNYQHQKVGETIIEGIVNIARKQGIAGCEFITVDAYHNSKYSAVGFYSKCQFYTLNLSIGNTTRMYRMLYPKEL